MRVTIEIEDGEARVKGAEAEGETRTEVSAAATQAAGAFADASGMLGESGSQEAVPADLAVRAALIGARSAGPAPSADSLGLSSSGAPGFPPAEAGAPRADGDNKPTTAGPDDLSGGAAPSGDSLSSGGTP